MDNQKTLINYGQGTQIAEFSARSVKLSWNDPFSYIYGLPKKKTPKKQKVR